MTGYSRTVIPSTAVMTVLGQHCRDHLFLLLLPPVICSNVIILQNDGKPRVEKKYYAVLAIILQAVGIFIGGISTLFVP